MAEVQTPAVASFKDSALLTFSIIAILGGIAAFYWFDERALLLRVGMVIVGLAAGAGLLWLSIVRQGVRAVCAGRAGRVAQSGVAEPHRDFSNHLCGDRFCDFDGFVFLRS